MQKTQFYPHILPKPLRHSRLDVISSLKNVGTFTAPERESFPDASLSSFADHPVGRIFGAAARRSHRRIIVIFHNYGGAPEAPSSAAFMAGFEPVHYVEADPAAVHTPRG